jgi:hypothetical protein
MTARKSRLADRHTFTLTVMETLKSEWQRDWDQAGSFMAFWL